MPCFYSLFSALLIICEVILVRTTFRVLALTRPQSSALLIEGLHRFYQGQHASNKLCALNNDVRLITRFYGIYTNESDRPGKERTLV